nr:recombinase family protein [Rhodococcus sp. UFZ-B548]
MLETVAHLESIDVGFTSPTEEINTTTSGDRLSFTIFGILVEFAQNLLRERIFAVWKQPKDTGAQAGDRPSSMTNRRPSLASHRIGIPRDEHRCQPVHVAERPSRKGQWSGVPWWFPRSLQTDRGGGARIDAFRRNSHAIVEGLQLESITNH